MLVNGCDCSIVIRTDHGQMDIPYSDETVREAVTLLEEEGAIEGDGVCKAISKNNGVTGCIITPLTINSAPFLLCLAMGPMGKSVFVSGTRNLYKYNLNLVPLEDTGQFDLIQDRQGKNEKGEGKSDYGKLYPGCRVKSFELRILRDEAIKLGLDITSEQPPVVYPNAASFVRETGERFSGDNVTYRIRGKEYKNIYGVTLITKKEGWTKTELLIKRATEQGPDLPRIIDEIIITAKLLRDKYECRHYGTFRIFMRKLLLISDETNVNSADTVIGPLRYFVAGKVTAEVFTNDK